MLENNHNTAYRQRLKEVVQRLGVAQLAAQVGISQAQLYRYLNGTPLPHPRLAAIAKATNVTTDWLLFGEQSKLLDINEVLQVVGHITQTTLATLQLTNENPVWRPSELQTLIPFLVLNELNLRRHQPNWQLAEVDVLRALDVLRPMRLNMELEPYVQSLTSIFCNPKHHLPPNLAGPFCKYVDSATTAYFERQAGESYFQRVAYHIKPVSLEWVKGLISLLEQKQAKQRLKLLDAGAGTARYLRYLHMNYPDWFELHGLERSSKAFKYIQEFENRQELPHGCIKKEDYLMYLGYPSNYFDVVISYMNLHYYPYIPQTSEHGVGKILKRFADWVKPQGIIHIVTRDGLKQTYSPYYSRAHSVEEMSEIGKIVGLKLIKFKSKEHPPIPEPGHEVPPGFEQVLELIFVKV